MAMDRAGVQATLPPMAFKVGAGEAWDAFYDILGESGRESMRFAERWAQLMQAEMEAGKPLADIVSATKAEAASAGSSPDENFATTFLCRYWLYGDQLRAALGDQQR